MISISCVLYPQERQKQELRQTLKKNYVFDSNIPIKVILAGPAFSGKTTLMKSLRYYASKNKGFRKALLGSKTPLIEPQLEDTYIAEDFKQRTVGAEFHLLKVDKDLYLNVQDLGGQECFYALHSTFIHNKDAIFFVVFNLQNSKEQIIEDVRNQLRIIGAHSYSFAQVILLGTHLDKVDRSTNKMDQTRCSLLEQGEKFNYNFSNIIFMNAKNPKDDEMAKLLKSTRELASAVKLSVVSDNNDFENNIFKSSENLAS